jgi:transposase
MDEKEGRESRGSAPAEERVVGDGVAGDERSGRGDGDAGKGFSPRGAPRRTARTVRPDAGRVANFTGEQRLLLLDAWMRSKLPASEFAPLVGVTATTLYGWRKRFEELGPAALLGHRRGQRGSQLPEPTRRAILMMKQAHPEWGQDRIHDMLIRTEGLEASARAVQRVLLEAGYEVEEAPTRPHPAKAKRFERTRPNELWQTDLFSFLLKRQRSSASCSSASAAACTWWRTWTTSAASWWASGCTRARRGRSCARRSSRRSPTSARRRRC